MATKKTAKKTAATKSTPKKAKAPAASKKKHASPSKAAKGDARASVAPAAKGKSAFADELAPLAKMGKTELWKLFEKVIGHKTTSCNTTYLRNAIAKKLSETGDASPIASVVEKASTGPATNTATPARASRAKEPKERDARLPPVGTVLEKEFQGTVHKVTVMEEGFRYKGETHRSLSGLAKQITGAVWNGFAWFGLAARPVKKSADTATSAPKIARRAAAPATPNTKAHGGRRG